MKIIKSIYNKILNIKTDFDKLFFEKEYLSLTEEFGINFFLVVFILFLTFFAFSFSIGSMDYLNKRMNNPFTNWVDVPVTVKVKNRLDDIEQYFRRDSIKKTINLKNISEYIINFRNFYSEDLENIYQIKGRTVQDTGSLFNKIVDNKNLVIPVAKTDIKKKYNNCGIIVTKKLIKDLGYNKNSIPSYLFMEQNDGVVSFSIAAIVNDLPNNSQFITSNMAYNMTIDPFASGFIVYQETTNIITLISKTTIDKNLSKLLEDKGYKVEMIKKDSARFSQDKAILYSIIFSKAYSFKTLRKLLKDVLKNKKAYGIYWNNECPEYNDVLKSPHRLAFNFTKLDKIREFKKKMKNIFKIEVNMAQVEAKENFSLVSNLTFILSLILFIFSMVSIIFFINSILTKHLQKINANLGTLKAFGISNKKLSIIYIKIIFTFLIVSGLVAYAINMLLSIILNILIGHTMFKFYSPYILLIFILIVIFSLFNSKHSIIKVLKNTPGDLIYGRK